MKVLETFHDFLNDKESEFYHKINYDEYQSMSTIEYFTTDEVESIINIVEKYKYQYHIVKDLDNTIVKVSIEKKLDNLDNSLFEIYKYDDEWFTVRYRKGNDQDIWKCDQLDGLLKLIDYCLSN